MATFIAAFILLLLAVGIMAIGIIFKRPAIQGSCGGLNNVGLSGDCSGACSLVEREECEHRKNTLKQS